MMVLDTFSYSMYLWIMEMMVKPKVDLALALEQLSALAHGGRLALFRLLVKAGPEGIAAGDVARASGTGLTTASAQLAVLHQARLVRTRRDGRSIIYAADFEAMRGLITFMMEDCCEGRREICAPLAEIASRAACCETS